MLSSTQVVALLFTDLVGSTAILQRLGDDGAEQLRRTHFSLLRQAVEAAGGQEVKTLGDGLMAVFTSPVQATQCAVDVQRAIEVHNRGQAAGHELHLRVGLHAGEPIEDEGDFHGTAVVVARRLCDAARGGQILASDLVAGLVGSRGGFLFRPVGPLKLKGLTDPLPAVEIGWRDPADHGDDTALAAGAARPRLQAHGAYGIVGREREIESLEREVERAREGEFRAVLLVGDAGVGKTRLASELLLQHQDDVIGMSARAYPLGATAAFGLWAEALEGHLRGLPGPELARLCRGLFDDLAGLLRSVAVVRGSAPEREPPRLRLLEAIADLLVGLTRQAPVMVVLDDVHLADASSWDLLGYLARTLARAPLLVVMTARRDELAEEAVAQRTVLSLQQDGLLSRIEVAPLDRPGLTDLVQAVLGRQPPAALVTWLDERSGGNALFALGLLRAVLEEEADLEAPKLRSLPEDLAERARARLQHLDPPAMGLLELLAVLGRRVELGELVTLAGPMDDLESVLQSLISQRFIREIEQGRRVTFEVTHPLTQEAIYVGIGPLRRRAIHRQLARGLRAAGRLAEAASHYVDCAEPGEDEAIESMSAALRLTEERAAYREALAILAAVVELLPHRDKRWLDIADAMSWEAEWVIDHMADVHTQMGVAAVREIDELLESSPDTMRRALVKFRLATFLAWGPGELSDAQRVVAEAVALFEAVGDRTSALLARIEAAFMCCLAEDYARGVNAAREVADEAVEPDDTLVRMRALYVAGIIAFFISRFEEADRLLNDSVLAARQAGRTFQQTRSLSLLAASLAFQGRLDEARATLQGARDACLDWQETPLRVWETMVHWLAGDFAASIETVEQESARCPTGIGRRMGIMVWFGALSALEAGDLGVAGRHVDLGRAAFGTQTFYMNPELGTHVETVLARRRGVRVPLSASRSALGQMLDNNNWSMAAPLLLDLAELGAEDGDAETVQEAAARLDDIAAGAEGLPLYRALADLGAAWSALLSGHNLQAAELADSAGTTFEALGYRGFLGRARALQGRCIVAPQPVRGTLPNGLSEREAEVLRLVAAGKTNKQIADDLYLSVKTVGRHMSNIFTKIDVNSRAAATTFAHLHGIL